MIKDFYDKVSVKIEYQGNTGSGVLISHSGKTETYLITAYHCLGEQVDIDYEKITTFRQIEGELERFYLKFRKHVIIKDNDVIIFTIDYLEDVPEYQIMNPEIKEEVTIAGFPNGLKGEDSTIHRYLLRGKVNDLPGKSIVQINSERNFDTYENDAKGNVSSYSGGGIFIESNDQAFLCGITTELGSAQGAFSIINGISILKIDEKLYEKTNMHLPNIKWCSFDEFVDGTLEIFDEPLMEVCSAQIPEIIKNISPNNIIEHCGNKVVWPYSDKNMLKKEVWEAWLLYLIIRCIENRENMKDENYYMLKGEDGDRKVKIIYSTKHTKLPDFLKDYLQNAYRDVKNGEMLIVKTDKTPTRKVLPSSSIDSIVANISKTVCVKEHLYIDDVESNMQHISLMHIRALVDEMANYVEENENLNGRELERKLSGKIMEVLHGI
ncbi:MAG: trypsin-like peptidase domain-containing protein [Lachnospiraceae bacterium]|nr:trypsin-like peptidase domain-containing protein [Lachnospiraceae bacterium]